MTPHIQFLILACVALAITLPAVIYAWRKHAPHRVFATVLYGSGYTLIGAAFIVDDILRPPLFVHGFVPGIGIGAIIIALATILQDTHALSQPAHRLPETSSAGYHGEILHRSEDPRQQQGDEQTPGDVDHRADARRGV